MPVQHRVRAHQGRHGAAIGIAAIVAVLLLVVMLVEHGLFAGLDGGDTPRATLPGITLDNDGSAHRPVVTSVRTNGEAERAGIRAGDEIESVDGRSVHDVSALRAAVLSNRPSAPLTLHIRRGDALWTVALDRSEPAINQMAATEPGDGAKDPAD